MITSQAQTRDGLFKTHRIGQRLLFEIPANQLEKDILVVMEVAGNPSGAQGFGGVTGARPRTEGGSIATWRLPKMLAADRQALGLNAPAEGLYFVEAKYPEQ